MNFLISTGFGYINSKGHWNRASSNIHGSFESEKTITILPKTVVSYQDIQNSLAKLITDAGDIIWADISILQSIKPS